MVTFENALEMVMELPFEERNSLIELIRKRQSQQWRKDTVDYYHSIKNDITSGNLKSINVVQALDELNNYLESSE